MSHVLLKDARKTVVSIVNQKGGVGKTVSVLALASGLALAGQRVLMIDGDPQGNLSLFFTDKAEADLALLFKDLLHQKPLDASRYVLRGVRQNLDLIPMRDRNLRSELFDKDLEGIIEAFFNWIQGQKAFYDWIFFDCSPSDGMLEQLLMASSDAVLVPLEYQLFSIAGLNNLLEKIEFCGKRLDRSILVEALIFTKAQSRLNRVKEYREIFKKFYIPIYEIGKSEVIPRAIEERKTIWEYSPTHFVCRDYYRIIEKSFIG